MFKIGIFNEILRNNETLFKNHIALDYDYIPKVLPFRQQQQRAVANSIQPLLQGRNGKNVLIHGPPGLGKTAACKNLFQEIEEETDEIYTLYINCWQKNTSYKILTDLCEQLGYKLTMNKKTDELFKVLKGIVNKKSVVFCFDEADKIEDFDFLYMILEEVYRKSIILITNYHDWLINLDSRIKSRLIPDTIEFKPYNFEETKGILKERMGFSFHPNIWEDPAFELIVSKTSDLEDIRSGLYLMKESGNIAENFSARNITKEHVKKAIEKLNEFSTKKSSDLEGDDRFILKIAKANPDKKIGDLYKAYQHEGGKIVYKTFQRRIAKLATNKFIKLTKTSGGTEGNTTIIKFLASTKQDKEKKLTEF